MSFIIAYTLIRTILPIEGSRPFRQQVELVVEAAAIGLAVAATDYFRSPVAFSVIAPIAAAGFLAGFGPSLRLASALTLAIGIPSVTQGHSYQDDIRLLSQWGVELFLVAVVAAYSRRITGDYDKRERLALDQLGRLADANELLVNLHLVAQDLPSSLEPDQALDASMARLRELLSFDVAAILLREDSDGSWTVARRYGGRLPDTYLPDELPPPVREAAATHHVVNKPNLLRSHQAGVSPTASSGMYRVLKARGSVVGVVAIERNGIEPYTARDADLLAGFAEPAALAIDNARWFNRLRTTGANEERTRLARDLHDRIGQSLAYLGFELDRIARKAERGGEVGDDLAIIREDVRGVVGEVRDTLYDLRTDVSDERSAPSVLEEFARRVEERSEMTVELDIDERARLPRQQERELWRIAQEAIVNAERHSRGSRIQVQWHTDGRSARVQVRDDGRGLTSGTPGRLDSYGMLGMRERADSIGATLAVESAPRHGVVVRVTIDPPTV